MQLLINKTTLEPSISLWITLAVYYYVTKSDKNWCNQKNMEFVGIHTTPSSVTAAPEGDKSFKFKIKDIKCFCDLWKQVFFLDSI